MKRHTSVVLAAAVCLTGILFAAHSNTSNQQGSSYPFIWSGDAAHQASDFLAVVDAKPSSASYGRIVATLPVGASGIMPHHTEYEFPERNILFANGWAGGRTFLLDLNEPLHPRVAGQFLDRDGYTLPHTSFVFPTETCSPPSNRTGRATRRAAAWSSSMKAVPRFARLPRSIPPSTRT